LFQPCRLNPLITVSRPSCLSSRVALIFRADLVGSLLNWRKKPALRVKWPLWHRPCGSGCLGVVLLSSFMVQGTILLSSSVQICRSSPAGERMRDWTASIPLMAAADCLQRLTGGAVYDLKPATILIHSLHRHRSAGANSWICAIFRCLFTGETEITAAVTGTGWSVSDIIWRRAQLFRVEAIPRTDGGRQTGGVPNTRSRPAKCAVIRRRSARAVTARAIKTSTNTPPVVPDV